MTSMSVYLYTIQVLTPSVVFDMVQDHFNGLFYILPDVIQGTPYPSIISLISDRISQRKSAWIG